jgi:hypothetical protein
MRINFILFFAIVISFGQTLQAQVFDKNSEAQNLVRQSLQAMGGEAKLRELKSLQIEGIGHHFWIEQSERPEGPWLVSYTQSTEIRDLVKNRLYFSAQDRHLQFPEWREMPNSIVADNMAFFEMKGRFFPNSPHQVFIGNQKLALAPEKVLFNALEAKDLRLEKDVQMQNVRQRVVKFTWNQTPVTIYLNAHTNLPTAVESLENSPYEPFFSVWGDFSMITYYTSWFLENGGIRYPHQWDVEKIGMKTSTFTATKLQFNVPIDEAKFTVPDNVKQQFAAQKLTKMNDLPLGSSRKPTTEIAPEVIKIPGNWDIAIVKQTDGIVIIEAPISSGYSLKVLDEAKRRFPNTKIKAVVTTSDAFPHIGGLREYVAQGIPIYALDINRPILEKLLNSPHTFEPDNLQKNQKKPTFKIVSSKTVLGEGANRLELYPMRGETSERMMMIYFPEHKLLYASDLIQKSPNGSFFMSQYLSETMQAVERERLVVNKVFAMHTEVIDWNEITSAVEKKVTAK